ncbi:DUF2141 domain-containing protein [Govanella unica]|uniref:DUF2141 domain-containing protein n=1 Tax=Govanella unica TaxID=2975056 RepID=A0A9X3TY85_9PROT|nr:DUF2141 domain-containing protein [Govania unica]MDA5194181.1 DUF2141 domain-containing protein [Govania unica]
MHRPAATFWLSVGLSLSYASHVFAEDAAQILGPEAAACETDLGTPAILVHVNGFKDRKGQIRVELYSDKKEDFLAGRQDLLSRNAVFKRIDVPVPPEGPVAICVEAPGAGRYSLVVLHDRNNNGKFNVFNDGVGFPNNPRLGLSKPDVAKATFDVTTNLTTLNITLNYLNGLKPEPVKHPQ